MKALVCTATGSLDALELRDVPAPTIGSGEVLVRVVACGINYPDVLLALGKYQVRPEPPFSPGGEVSGIVEAVGAGVSSVKPGDRVLGMLPFGGLAEKVALPEQAVLRVPEGADLVVASGVVRGRRAAGARPRRARGRRRPRR